MANKAQSDNTDQIKKFFDGHADDYRQKYSGDNLFYQYFFFERMQAAVDGFDFTNKRILDIGSGTGSLYDYLKDEGEQFKDFVATDISEGMLSYSKVPEQSKICGDFLKIDFEGKYDYVFMLGVSTYLKPKTNQAYLDKISEILSENGILVITFTNKDALDTRIRSLLKPVLGTFPKGSRIISQSFETYYFTFQSFKDMWESKYVLRKQIGLNHTVFPISRLFPGASIKLAKKIHRLKNDRISSLLSSDILLQINLAQS